MENLKKIPKKFIIIPVVVIILLIPILFLILYKPSIELKYNDEVIKNDTIDVSVNSEFNNPSFVAKYFGNDVSSKVNVKGDVDNTKIGEYKITYEIDEGISKKEVTITVNVIDNEAPVITLTGAVSQNVCSIDSFSEEGYTATDNYDGDITDKVVVTKEDNKVIYTVSDSSSNETSVSRDLVISDAEGPVITINGGSSAYVALGGTYTEGGATATDNCDTNIDNITTSGSVDTSKVGSYTITYKATDKAGNATTKTKTVYVYNPATATNTSGGEKGVIYLTFDDGPSAYTGAILDILAKYNIKATFFVTNNGPADAITREYNEGHTVALHTATHSYKYIYSSVDAYFEDLTSVQNRVKSLTGFAPTIIRFPGGSSNTVSKFNKGIMTILTNEVLNRGFHYFDWNVCVEDAGSCAYKSGYENKKACVLSYFKGGLSKNRSNVVLMHDIKSYTKDSLEAMIQYALANGYTFDKLTMDTVQVHHHVNN